MFTGLIEAVGTLHASQRRGRVVRLSIAAPLASELTPGQSIAIDGACLTVVEVHGDLFEVEATGETLRRTTLAHWRGPREVNLERSLRADGRFDGHLVTGHVDGVVRIRGLRPQADGLWMDVAYPPDLTHLIAAQGSVALDGVSLTVAACHEDTFAVSLIPYTLSHTTLGRKKPGDYLNIEVDLVARYVARLLLKRPRREEGPDEWV